jgi:hypothetical protein
MVSGAVHTPTTKLRAALSERGTLTPEDEGPTQVEMSPANITDARTIPPTILRAFGTAVSAGDGDREGEGTSDGCANAVAEPVPWPVSGDAVIGNC